MNEALDEMIARLRSVPERLYPELLPKIAEILEGDIKQTINAQEDPDGNPWIPRKRGNAPVLVNAAKAVHVGTLEHSVLVRLTGVEARHQLGAVKGRVAREIIPVDKLPPEMMRKISEAAEQVLGGILNG